jgi:phage regulator Rha-like protein/DNA-binding transcriptional MerR regulator
MNIFEGFTRKEVMDLAGTTSNRLQYLERSNLIKPYRVEKTGRPTVLYTWEQLLEIRAIKNLRQSISLQTVRKIIEFLDKSGFDDTLRNKQLICLDEDVFWVKSTWEEMPEILKVAAKRGKGVGQYTLLVIPALIDVVNEVWEAAGKSSVVDMESFRARAKAKGSSLVVFEYEGVLVVDSRLVAVELGIEHNNFMETIRKYRTQTEEAFGQLLFQIGVVPKRGGNPPQYVFLTEEQATFLMTLSRNTPEVVQSKRELVQKFFEARELLRRGEATQPLYATVVA